MKNDNNYWGTWGSTSNILNEEVDINDKENKKEIHAILNNNIYVIDEFAESSVLSIIRVVTNDYVTILLTNDLTHATLNDKEINFRGERVTASISNKIEKWIIHRNVL